MHPKIQIAFTGSRAHIQCNSVYFPQWIRNGEILPIRSYSLVIDHIEVNDGGKYFCKGVSPENKTFMGKSQILVGGTLAFFQDIM